MQGFKFLWIVLLLLAHTIVLAQYSAPQLSSQDTIFIHLNEAGIKTHYHSVKQGQTPLSIKEYYRLSDKEWTFFNPKLANVTYLVPGQVVVVPIPNRAIIRYEASKDLKTKKYIPIYHVVKKGETCFGVAKRSYRIPVELLKERNGLISNQLSVGQTLHVGWFDLSGIPVANGARELSPELIAMMPYHDCYFERLKSRDEYEQKGMAVQSDVGVMRSGYKVLHDRAKIGQCIRITDPGRKKTVYAEVVGRIPSSIRQQYFGRTIIAVYTPTIKKALGLTDRQFYAVIRYTD